jgi:hypothetical protein
MKIWAAVAAAALLAVGAPAGASAQDLMVEGEHGCGHGQTMPRSNASRLATTWLRAAQQRMMTLHIATFGRYQLDVRYSNDGLPGERIEIVVNGTPVVGTPFVAKSTGSGGHGWNSFTWSGALGPVSLRQGVNTIEAKVLPGGDGFGWELDAVRAWKVG